MLRWLARSLAVVLAASCGGDATAPEEPTETIPDLGGAWIVEFVDPGWSFESVDPGATVGTAACTMNPLRVILQHTGPTRFTGRAEGLRIHCSHASPPLDTVVEFPPLDALTGGLLRSCSICVGPGCGPCEAPFSSMHMGYPYEDGPDTWRLSLMGAVRGPLAHPDSLVSNAFGGSWISMEHDGVSRPRITFSWTAVRER